MPDFSNSKKYRYYFVLFIIILFRISSFIQAQSVDTIQWKLLRSYPTNWPSMDFGKNAKKIKFNACFNMDSIDLYIIWESNDKKISLPVYQNKVSYCTNSEEGPALTGKFPYGKLDKISFYIDAKQYKKAKDIFKLNWAEIFVEGSLVDYDLNDLLSESFDFNCTDTLGGKCSFGVASFITDTAVSKPISGSFLDKWEHTPSMDSLALYDILSAKKKQLALDVITDILKEADEVLNFSCNKIPCSAALTKTKKLYHSLASDKSFSFVGSKSMDHVEDGISHQGVRYNFDFKNSATQVKLEIIHGEPDGWISTTLNIYQNDKLVSSYTPDSYGELSQTVGFANNYISVTTGDGMVRRISFSEGAILFK